MRPRPLFLPLALVATLLTAGAAAAQPGFGKPKPKPRPDGNPAPVAPADKPSGSEPPATSVDDALLRSTGNPAAPGWSEWKDTDPERLAPSSDATPGKAYAWKTREGLRYTWTLPLDYKKGEGYDLVVLCHPDRADFRWGTQNHPTPQAGGDRGFRPGDIVVAIDGTSANQRNPDMRTFEPTTDGIIHFRDLVLEVSRTFPVNRIYLYGMGGGGSFLQCFAAAFPALADGAVAHGCTAPSDCVKKGSTPLVLMHGAKDLVVPLHVSFDAQRAYIDAEHKNVRVRVLQSFNDFPNPVRASECIDWVKAMRTDNPEQLLASVRSMLTPKRPDEYEYRTAVWFGAAREALGRLVGESDSPLKDVPPEAAAAARTLIDKLEAEGARHVAILKGQISAAQLADQPLDGKPWLGHLVALREDFRGVHCVEEYMATLGYDTLAAEHDSAALGFTESWAPDGDAKAAFEEAVDTIRSCWLSQFLPLGIGPRMRSLARKADELKFAADAMEKFEYFQNWEKSWKEGLDAYETVWRKWEGP